MASDIRDVRPSVEGSARVRSAVDGRPEIQPDVMVSISMLGRRARFFFRGRLSPSRADALSAFLRRHSLDGMDVVDRTASIGHMLMRCDVLLDPSVAPSALGLVGGSLSRGGRDRRRR